MCIVKCAFPPAYSLLKSCLSFFMCVGSGISCERGGPTAQMLGNNTLMWSGGVECDEQCVVWVRSGQLDQLVLVWCVGEVGGTTLHNIQCNFCAE